MQALFFNGDQLFVASTKLGNGVQGKSSLRFAQCSSSQKLML
jgi:hypothetical protein